MIIPILELASAGISLANTITKRIAPKEFKELKRLEMVRLDIEKKLDEYHVQLPSMRIQAKKEQLLRSHKNVCKKLVSIQKFTEIKFKQMGIDISNT